MSTIAEKLETVVTLIEQAKDGQAHVALGYRSWPECVVGELSESFGRLTRAELVPIVLRLREHGLSTRVIGDCVNVSKDTVRRIVNATGANAPVDPEPSSGADAPPDPEPPIIGRNGKQYRARKQLRDAIRKPRTVADSIKFAFQMIDRPSAVRPGLDLIGRAIDPLWLTGVAGVIKELTCYLQEGFDNGGAGDLTEPYRSQIRAALDQLVSVVETAEAAGTEKRGLS
jgi:hypothetical protein